MREYLNFWGMKEGSGGQIGVLRKQINETIAAAKEKAQDNRAAAESKIAAAREAKSSTHLVQADETYLQSRAESNKERERDLLRAAWAHLEEHLKELPDGEDRHDSRFHALSAAVKDAMYHLGQGFTAVSSTLTRYAPGVHATNGHSVAFAADPVSETWVYDAEDSTGLEGSEEEGNDSMGEREETQESGDSSKKSDDSMGESEKESVSSS